MEPQIGSRMVWCSGLRSGLDYAEEMRNRIQDMLHTTETFSKLKLIQQL